MPLQRSVLIWMCVLVAVNQLGFGAVMPSLPLYAQSFGVAASAIGLAIAVYGLARFLVALPTGILADRLGRRPTLAIGGAISGLGNLWCAVASSYPEFIVARFVAGFGAGLVVTTGQVVLADISTPAERGRMISIYQGTFIFAVGIGPFPGGLLAQHMGLAAPFAAYGILALIVSAVAWLAVAETRDFGARAGGKPMGGRRATLADQLGLLRDQLGFLLVSLIALMSAVVRTGGLFAIVPVLAADRLKMSVAAIGFAIMLGSLAGAVAAYPAGWAADRWGRKAAIVPAAVMSGTSMMLFCVAPSPAWFTAGAIVWGIAISVGSAAPAAYAADSAPPGMNAAAISTYRMMGDAGYVIGPLTLGFVADLWGPVVALVGASGMLIFVGLLFALFAPETHRGDAA